MDLGKNKTISSKQKMYLTKLQTSHNKIMTQGAGATHRKLFSLNSNQSLQQLSDRAPARDTACDQVSSVSPTGAAHNPRMGVIPETQETSLAPSNEKLSRKLSLN